MSLSNTLKIDPHSGNQDQIENKVLEASVDTNPKILTIHAEILLRILRLKDNAEFLLMPKIFVKNAIKSISVYDNNETVKTSCHDLLTIMGT